MAPILLKVHRAELAGIAAAVTHDYFLIATNNSMRQIRKQIRYPELRTYHIHHTLLETIIKAIRNSATLSIKFLKVKAHTGIIGNERADQIAKHVAKDPEAADTGIKMAGHEGNPFHNIIWLATTTDDPNTLCPIIDNGYQSQPYLPHMRYLSNKRDALQAHVHKVHKLDNAQTDTSYNTYYQNLIENKSAHSKISNAFWSISGISHKEKETAIKYDLQPKHAVRFKQSNSLSCPICSCQDSALHILSGCQHPIIKNMVTKRHSIAGRLITKAISKGSLGSCLVSTDVGSADKNCTQSL